MCKQSILYSEGQGWKYLNRKKKSMCLNLFSQRESLGLGIIAGHDIELKAGSHAQLTKPHKAFEPKAAAPSDEGGFPWPS